MRVWERGRGGRLRNQFEVCLRFSKEPPIGRWYGMTKLTTNMRAVMDSLEPDTYDGCYPRYCSLNPFRSLVRGSLR